MTRENPVCPVRALLQNRVLDTNWPSLLLERVRQVLTAVAVNQGPRLEQTGFSVLDDSKFMGEVCRRRHLGLKTNITIHLNASRTEQSNP